MMFKENIFNEALLRIKLRGKFKDTPSKIIKIMIEEGQKIIDKRSKKHESKK